MIPEVVTDKNVDALTSDMPEPRVITNHQAFGGMVAIETTNQNWTGYQPFEFAKNPDRQLQITTTG